MISIIALLMTVLAPATVTELSIVPAGARTEVVIRVDAGVQTRDFMMDDGRLVLDFEGAETRGARWDRINRGGVRGLRVAQLQPGIARVVIELVQPLEYEVTRESNAVRVSFPNPAGEFAPWTSGGQLADAAASRSVSQQAPQDRKSVVWERVERSVAGASTHRTHARADSG